MSRGAPIGRDPERTRGVVHTLRSSNSTTNSETAVDDRARADAAAWAAETAAEDATATLDRQHAARAPIEREDWGRLAYAGSRSRSNSISSRSGIL